MTQLVDNAIQLLSTPPLIRNALPNPLDAQLIAQEAEYAAVHLRLLTNHYREKPNDAAFKAALRHFFKIRWSYIRRTTAAYIEYPASPINQLCQRLAILIAHPQELIAQMLMPTLKILDYDISGETLRDITEYENRSLALGNFILNENEDGVIPLKDWFDSRRPNAQENNHFYLKEGRVVPLTELEIQYLKTCAVPASQEFFRVLEARSIMLRTEGNLASALQKLCGKLRDSGRHRNGIERLAALPVDNEIAYFSVTVIEPLSTDIKRRIFPLGWPYTFESHLLRLRSGVASEYIKFTEEQKHRVHTDALSTCVETNADYLQDILDANYENFRNITVAGGTAQSWFTSDLNFLNAKVNLDRQLNEMNRRGGAFNPHRYPLGMRQLREFQAAYRGALNKRGISRLSDLAFYQEFCSENIFREILSQVSLGRLRDMMGELLRHCESHPEDLSFSTPYGKTMFVLLRANAFQEEMLTKKSAHTLFYFILDSNNDVLHRLAVQQGILYTLAFYGFEQRDPSERVDLAVGKLISLGIRNTAVAILGNSHIDDLSSYYGLRNLCTFTGSLPNSLNALKLYAKVELIRIVKKSDTPSYKTCLKINALRTALENNQGQEQSVGQTIVHALNLHRARLFTYGDADSYKFIPDVLKQSFPIPR